MADGYEDLVWPDPPGSIELDTMSVRPGAPARDVAESPGIAARLNEEAAARNAQEAQPNPFVAPEIPLPYDGAESDDGLMWPEPPSEEFSQPIDTSSIEGDPTWQDYGRMVMSGGASVGAGVGWILEKLGSDEVGTSIKERSLESARSWMEDRLDVIGLEQEGLSDQARVAMEQELLGESITGDSKFNKIKLLAAGSLLGTMAGAGAGVVMTKGLQAAGVSSGTAATVGFGLGEASVAAPSAGAYTEQQVMDMPLEQLSQGLEFQATMLGIRGDYDNPEDVEKARTLVAKMAGNDAAALTLGTTFVLSAPFGKVLDKLYAGGGATSASLAGRTMGAVKGGATEATQEFLQSGSEKFSENLALLGVDPSMTVDDLGRGMLEEALAGAGAGTAMGAPMGARMTPEARQAAVDEQINKLEEVQRKAEEQAAMEGGDELDQAVAGQVAVAEASDFAAEVIAELNAQEELDRESVEGSQATAQEVVGPAQPAEVTDQEVAAEIETELEREQVQAEAAEKYTEGVARGLQEQRAYAAREAEKEAAKESDTKEAEYQKELQKGEGVKAIEEAGVESKPGKTSVGEVLRTAQQQKKAKEAKGLPARRILEQEKAKPALLEDKRPSRIVVDPEGAARPMTAAELDAQIRRRSDIIEQQELGLEIGDKEAPNIPVRVMGLDLNIENPKGSTRKGTDPEGNPWSQTYDGAHYGNITGIRGADNERLDVYVGEQDWRPKGQKVWVVNQYKPDGTFDEHKVMMGFGNQAEAESIYDRHNGGGMLKGEIVEMSMEEFKSWGFDGKRKNKPLASPEVLQVASEADIEVMQQRTKPGRKKPQVVYKLGNASVSVERDFQEDIVVEGTDSKMATGPSTRVVANEGGKEIGHVVLRQRGDKMQITWATVEEGARGRGLGQQLIVEAAREANRQGYELTSDTQVSIAQLRAYEAARKRGDIVVEYSDPAAVQDALAENSDLSSEELLSSIDNVNTGYEPVVKRIMLPEFFEEILYRRENQPDTEEGFSNNEVKEVIKLLLDFMPGIKPDQILIVENVQDLPMEYYAELSQSGNLDARGFYDRENDVIAVVLDNHPNKAQAIKTFMHEAVGHYGMIKVFGEDLYPLMEDIWENGNRRAIMDIADRYGLDISSLPDRLQAVEEYVAHLAEDASNMTRLERIVNFVREILRNAGLLDSWTDSDIQSLLRDVRRDLRSKPLDKVTVSTEAEIEETGEIVTLEQPADVALRRHDKRVSMIERLRECVG